MKRIGWTLLFGLVMAGGWLTAADPPASAKRLPVFLPESRADEARIEAALGEQGEINFAETPLTDAVDFLRDFHQITIIIDERALQDEGVDPSTPVTIQLRGVTLRSALRLILKPLGAVAVVENEVLKITTETAAWSSETTRIYPVGDLADTAEDFEALEEAIHAGTGDVWDKAGEPGVMAIVPKSKCLVIRHNRIVHEDIVELLTNLRAAHALTQE